MSFSNMATPHVGVGVMLRNMWSLLLTHIYTGKPVQDAQLETRKTLLIRHYQPYNIALITNTGIYSILFFIRNVLLEITSNNS